MLLPFWSMGLLHLHFLLLLFVGAAASSRLGNESDHLALLKFKESISHDPFHILASWNHSSHFCNWQGITCSSRHQRVQSLTLNGYSLKGSLSPHVGNLSFLRSIYLRNNSLFGEIPQELGRLYRLQRLFLSNNTFSGQFPINITRCSQLRYLAFDLNNLIGKIPSAIGSLQKLEVLYLDTNNLTGQIPYSLWNLSSMTDIILSYNNLEGSIPEEIGVIKNLRQLGVGVNKLSGELPSSLYNLSSLQVIAIPTNKFNGSLPPSMFLTLPKLLFFEMGDNQISGPIPMSITNASFLQILDIGFNSLSGEVPSDLGKLQDLEWLSFYQNNLGHNSTNDLDFLKPLTNCSKLSYLDMSFNNFGGPLPNYIGNLSNLLEELHIFNNNFFGSIPESIGNLINLFFLSMSSNHLTQNIPATFGKLQRMQALVLSENKLSGEIPFVIGNLSQLFHLDLSINAFEGNIPDSIENCQILQYLDLSQNNLIGVIPREVFSHSSLTLNFLYLSRNSFNGNLPSEVGKLKNINELDVSHNHLSNHIPETIGDCIVLEYLNLGGNSFEGIIPSSLASLKGLQHLDLSRNNLTGPIPKGLQDIPLLKYLDVSFNMLEGEVSNQGVFRNATAISVIGNSKLCGGILKLQLPPCPIKAMKQKKHHNFKLIALISFVVAALLLLSLIFAFYHIKKRNKKLSQDSLTINQLSKVSYQSLHNATDGFSIKNLIGSGSFGSVYRGKLSEETVAIKVLNLQKKGAHKSFIAECNALRNIRHRNLVKVLTCCSSIDYKGDEFKAIVFEYMENGSLEQWLHPSIDESANHLKLLLDQRLNVITNVASALHYLHCECEQGIIHCDLKPSNILLDGDMVAHVSDFGLARLVSDNQSSTTGLKGTIGYAPPEYGMGSTVSTQGDMYSFGTLILDLFTGRRPTDEMFKDGEDLHNYVKIAFTDHLLQIADPNLFPSVEGVATNEEENGEIQTVLHPNLKKFLASIFKIGLACSVKSPNERMDITEVIRELNHIRNVFSASEINGG